MINYVTLYRQTIEVWEETDAHKPKWALRMYIYGCPFCSEFLPQCVKQCPLSYNEMYGCERVPNSKYTNWARHPGLVTAQAFLHELQDDLALLESLGYTDDTEE